MNSYSLERKQVLPVSPTEAFEFFQDPSNLAPLAPPWLRLRLVEPFPKPLRKGALVEYRIRIFRLRMHWVVLTTEFDHPNRIQDEQVRGPFKSWKATREFRRVKDGTEMAETARYSMRFSILGVLLHAIFVGPRLHRVFDYRTERIQAAFGPPPSGGKTEQTKAQR